MHLHSFSYVKLILTFEILLILLLWIISMFRKMTVKFTYKLTDLLSFFAKIISLNNVTVFYRRPYYCLLASVLRFCFRKLTPQLYLSLWLKNTKDCKEKPSIFRLNTFSETQWKRIGKKKSTFEEFSKT